MALYFRGLEHNSAAPDYAYGHEGVPPTISTLRQLQEDTCKDNPSNGPVHVEHVRKFRRARISCLNNLVFSQICGLIVLILAFAGLTVAWRRNLFFNRGLPWACLLLFTFLTAAFVCVGRVWRGDVQPLTPRYTTFGTLCVISVIVSLYSGFSGLAKGT